MCNCINAKGDKLFTTQLLLLGKKSFQLLELKNQYYSTLLKMPQKDCLEIY